MLAANLTLRRCHYNKSQLIELVFLIKTAMLYFICIQLHRTMYWTDPARSVIETSYMNGNDRKTMELDDIQRPNHIMIDFQNEKQVLVRL